LTTQLSIYEKDEFTWKLCEDTKLGFLSWKQTVTVRTFTGTVYTVTTDPLLVVNVGDTWPVAAALGSNRTGDAIRASSVHREMKGFIDRALLITKQRRRLRIRAVPDRAAPARIRGSS
jgi:hypothetical protein